jgi:5-methylthioadenosine/S-adenosylhomocysteine deaminase
LGCVMASSRRRRADSSGPTGLGSWPRSRHQEPAPPAAAARELAVRAAPAEAIGLQGCVLTPPGRWRTAMSCRRRPPDPSRPAQQPQGCESRPPVGDPARPAGSARPPRVQRVRGWEPPQLFATRYLWRGSPSYQALVRDSQDRLLEAGLGDEELRYAEIRALVGGVTAIQGPAAAPAAPKRPWSAILTCASSASTEPAR